MWSQIWIWIEFLLTQSYLSQGNLLKRFTELFPSGLRLSSGSSLSRSVLLPWDKVGCPSFIMQRRTWHPPPVLLPGKSHGRRGLVGYSPQGHEESDMTERLHFHFSLSCIGEGNGNPTPVFLPGESQGRGSLVGCRLWGHRESDASEGT